MLTWSNDPTAAIETVSAASAIVTPVTITLEDALATPTGYSITSTDFPTAFVPNIIADSVGLHVDGTLSNIWDYISLDYLDWSNTLHTVSKLVDLPDTSIRKNLVKLEYDPTATIDYHIQVECTYELVAAPGSYLTEVATFFWTLENDFTANKNTLASLLAEEQVATGA